MSNCDQVKCLLLKCDMCHKLLIEPVIIHPCDNIVCKSHINKELTISENQLKCVFCPEKVKHTVPEEGYVVNKRLQNALSIEIYKLKLNPEYSECKQKIEEAMHQFNNIEIISQDPSGLINNYFGELKSHVNWRRDDLKTEVDKYADELIQSIENNQSNCVKLSQETSQLSKSIEDSKKQLDELKNHLDTFVIDTLNFDSIKASAEDLIERFSQMQTEYRESLLLHQDYVFDFDDDDPTKSIEYFFGKIIDTKMIDRIVKIIFHFHKRCVIVFKSIAIK